MFVSEVVTKSKEESSSSESEDDLVAGIFKVKSKSSKKKTKLKNDIYHQRDCSKPSNHVKLDEINFDELKSLIKDCFVTGKWSSSEDAQQLLDEDGKCDHGNLLVYRA